MLIQMFFRVNTLVWTFIKFQLQLRFKYLNDIVSICMAQLCGTSFLVELHHTQQWTPQQHDCLLLFLTLILGRHFCRQSLCGRPTPCTPRSRLLTWFTSHFGSCRNGEDSVLWCHHGCWFALPGLWVSLLEAGLWLPLLDTGFRVPSLDCPLHRPLSRRNFL